MALTRQLTSTGAVLANRPFPDDMEMFEPNVTVILWFKTAPKVEAVADAIEKHLWPCHRFNSCIEGRTWVRRHETMDRSYHCCEKTETNETAVEEFALREQLSPLANDHPRWRFFVLHTPPSHRSAVVVNVHHALGDGLGMLLAMSPLMGVEGGNPLSTVPLPPAVMPKWAKKPDSSPAKAAETPSVMDCFSGIRKCLRGFFSPALTGYDTELSINEPYSKRKPTLKFSGKRRLTQFPAVPLSLIQEARKKQHCTLNDVVMSALTGAFRRYCLEVGGDEKLKSGGPVECKAIMMLAMPRECSSTEPYTGLVNKMLFSSTPLALSEADPVERTRKTVDAMSYLKSPGFLYGLSLFTKMAGKLPRAVLSKANGEEWSKHTFLVTNVPATRVPMSIPAEGGEQVQGITLAIANVMTQISIISYNGQLYVSMVADPDVIRAPKQVADFFLSEMKELAVSK